MVNIEDMMDKVIKKFGMETPEAIEFCRLCELPIKRKRYETIKLVFDYLMII